MPHDLTLGIFQMFGSPARRGVSAWRHPASDHHRFHELRYWTQMAADADRLGYDFLFLADSFGYPSHDGRILDVAAREGLNFPMLDPQVLLSGMAAVTQRLGLVVTETTGLHHPLESARRLATLDHLTQGRLGVNVVTGSIQDVLARLFGHAEMTAHDDRYDRADEYLRLMRRYWQDAYAPGAVDATHEAKAFVDPAGLRLVEHDGTHYRSHGHFSVDPSPQGTPVIFQAGSSGRGKEFAAEHADCVLAQAADVARTAATVSDVHRLAAEHGRDPEQVRVLVTMSMTVKQSAAHAQELAQEFRELQSDEVVAAMYLANTGIDLLALDPELPLSQREHGASVGQIGQSNIDRFSRDGHEPTVGQILAELRGRGLSGAHLVGDPSSVADQLVEYVEATGLSGVMLDPVFGTADVLDAGELLLPELVRRGLRSKHPHPGTLREQLGLPDRDLAPGGARS